jgi:C4-type Zn-finger protein
MQDDDDITKVERAIQAIPKCPLCRHTLRLEARVSVTPTGEDYYVESWSCVKCNYSEVIEVISEL